MFKERSKKETHSRIIELKIINQGDIKDKPVYSFFMELINKFFCMKIQKIYEF